MSGLKQFHIGDLITVTTGRLVSTRHMDGVYDILNWMTGESLFTHQLPRVSREAEPVLTELYPQLSKASLATDLKELDCRLAQAANEQARGVVNTWVDELSDRLGLMFAVPKLSGDQHERIDPMSELAEKVHPNRIVVIET